MIHPCEYDVQLPTLASCNNPGTPATIFIHFTSLCLIITRIKKLSLQHHNIHPEGSITVYTELQSWLHDLPEELRLYNHGERNSYSLPVFNIQLLYLASLIWLSLLPGAHRQSTLLCTVSFVASSCIARLYEEILYHEDVHLLLPIHGWIITVAAVPQIYSISKFPDQESTSIEELDLLTSIVSEMSTKHASAAMVLRKITSFRNDKRNLPSMISPRGDESVISGDEYPFVMHKELFKDIGALLPFPDSMCPRMKLMQLATEGSDETLNSFPLPFMLDEVGWWSLDWSMTAMDNATGFGGFPDNNLEAWDYGSMAP